MNGKRPGNVDESGLQARSGADGSLKPYHGPVLLVHGRLRDLTLGAASGSGDGSSFGKKPPKYPKH
jgi:hypothetical protein